MTIRRLLVFSGCVVASAFLACGLAKAASFKYSERLSEILDSRGDGEILSYTGSITFTSSLATIDLGAIKPQTVFQLTLGDFVLATPLNGDPTYVAGATKAFVTNFDYGFTPPLPLNRIALSWTATNLSAAITLIDLLDPTNTITALRYNSRSGSFQGVLQGSAQLGETVFARALPFSGTTTMTAGTTPAGLPGTSVDVQISGLADETPPVVTILSPTNNARILQAQVTLTGRASDATGVSNLVARSGTNETLPALGTTNWSVDLPLLPGTNLLQAWATDLNGNTSTAAVVKVFYALTAPLAISVVGSGSFSPNYRGQLLDINRAYSMTAAASNGHKFAYWLRATNQEQGLKTFSNRLDFIMQSNLAVTAVFADTNWPTVAVTNLIANQRLSNAVFSAKGTAKDNAMVSNVWYRLNTGAWNQAAGLSNWTALLTFSQRTNSFQAYAEDAAGNHSKTNTLSLVYVMTDRLRLDVTGRGIFSPNYSNALLEIGQNYSTKAIATNGHRFIQWRISTNWVGGSVVTNQTLAFQMVSNLTLTAIFADTNWPTVQVTNLAANQRISSATFTVKGTAKDNVAVSNVWCQLNAGAWTAAVGTSSWSMALLLKPGTNIFLACAADAAGNYSTTNTIRFVCTATNRLPTAGAVELSTARNREVVLAASNVLARCSDPDGDPLVLFFVNPSTNGASTLLSSGMIHYWPVANFAGTDRFGFTVSDGRGGTATNEVRVDVYPATLPALGVAPAAELRGRVNLWLRGIPGRNYQIERAPDLNATWTTITNVAMPAAGTASWADTNLPPGRAYYRARIP